jgi:hypothetical protein
MHCDLMARSSRLAELQTGVGIGWCDVAFDVDALTIERAGATSDECDITSMAEGGATYDRHRMVERHALRSDESRVVTVAQRLINVRHLVATRQSCVIAARDDAGSKTDEVTSPLRELTSMTGDLATH